MYVYILLLALLCFVFWDDKPTLIFMIAALVFISIIFRKKEIININFNPIKHIFEPPKSSPIVERLKIIIKPLLSEYDYNRLKIYDLKDNFSGKNVGWTSDKTAIHICTKNKETGEPEDIEVLTYVLIHELAHFTCAECIQHSESWKLQFMKMLKKADFHKIRYKKKNQICGVCVN